jgi:hypothetical protein
MMDWILFFTDVFSGKISLWLHHVDGNWYSIQYVKMLSNKIEFEMNQLENLNKFELLNKWETLTDILNLNI